MLISTFISRNLSMIVVLETWLEPLPGSLCPNPDSIEAPTWKAHLISRFFQERSFYQQDCGTHLIKSYSKVPRVFVCILYIKI